MKFVTIEQLNRITFDGAEAIRACNDAFEAEITKTAREIYEQRSERSVILLSGPSGSGKTTSAKKIEKYLDEHDAETHTISMDDYFRTLTTEQLDMLAEGNLDLESPERLDIDLLNEQIESIAKCKPVHLPKYDFVTSTQTLSDETFCRKEGELVVFEGIHALNPAVIKIDEGMLNNIYVSVRTRIRTEEGHLLHPSYIRLMRRMLRDKLTRNRSFEETVEMYKTVQAGEEKYIAPYKNRARFQIDTFIPYEAAVYKGFLGDIQGLVGEKAITEALRELKACDPGLVPEAALIREFIG